MQLSSQFSEREDFLNALDFRKDAKSTKSYSYFYKRCQMSTTAKKQPPLIKIKNDSISLLEKNY